MLYAMMITRDTAQSCDEAQVPRLVSVTCHVSRGHAEAASAVLAQQSSSNKRTQRSR